MEDFSHKGIVQVALARLKEQMKGNERKAFLKILVCFKERTGKMPGGWGVRWR